ncbi:MAG: LPS-assembly protein LptD [Sporomusaceae bacterium]|nr:LPS-assembly protein LptD [Sporomusaceae bacterium]
MKKFLGGVLLAALIIVPPLTAAAAETAGNLYQYLPNSDILATANKEPEAKVAKKKENGPIVIEAEEIYFSDLTGAMFAKGAVTITQDKTKLKGDLIRGNAKQNQIWIDDKANYNEPGVALDGSQINYNYGKQTGTMQKTTGKIGRDFVVGETVEFLPGEYIITNGTMTMCPAKVPDYHVSATKVEIWPGDKMVAYNAKFWIKNTLIYSTPKYQKSLKDDKSEFPRIGYSSKDGVWIAQNLEYPIYNSDTSSVGAFVDLAYYSKRGFKPTFGVFDREPRYAISVIQGEFRDGNSYLIKKEPEFRFDYYNRRLGKLPVSYNFYAIYGKWTDSSKTSWHQDYYLYFTGDPIKFSQKHQLILGTGLERVNESYNSSTSNIQRYDATLYQFWSPKLTTWEAYHYIRNNYSLFDYGSNALGRQLDLGFSYTFDRLNTISFVQTYDVKNNSVYDQDVTWYRNLHCWQATITYRIKRSEWIWLVNLAKF